MPTILLICIFSTFAMTGLIWLIQLVHYPLFGKVGEEQFVAYETAHSRRITPIVMPLMVAELLSCLWLAWRPETAGQFMAPQWLWVTAAAMAVLIWISTAVLQVPMHNRLEQGFNEQVWRSLVNTNWIRTALWSSRSVILIVILYQ